MVNRMVKILRIVFCILAVAAAAAAIFVFVYAGWLWGLITVLICVVFTAGMLICRNVQNAREAAENPPPKGDFITGKIENDDKRDK